MDKKRLWNKCSKVLPSSRIMVRVWIETKLGEILIDKRRIKSESYGMYISDGENPYWFIQNPIDLYFYDPIKHNHKVTYWMSLDKIGAPIDFRPNVSPSPQDEKEKKIINGN